MPKKLLETYKVEYLQILDETGKADDKLVPKIDKKKLLDMYRTMVLARRADDKQLALQRQGKIGTFAQVKGQANCFLSMTYSRARWKQSSAAPNDPHAIPYRALLRQLKGPFSPVTSS